MDNYKVTIKETSQELSVKERIKIKDTSSAQRLDAVLSEQGKLILSPEAWAILDIYNPRSENPEYYQYVVIDKSGEKYVTGSTSFWQAFSDIWSEVHEAEIEDFEIEVFKADSKNYKGKQFITCSLV